MSQQRLPIILSQVLRKRCVGIGRCIRRYSMNTWNPPKIKWDLQGESISARAMRQNDVSGVINLIKSRELADFAESDIPCAMQCSNFYGVVAENSAGEMIGCSSVMKYGCNVAAVSHAMVIPAYRGMGIITLFFHYLNKYIFPEGFVYSSYTSEDNKSIAARSGARLDSKHGPFLRMVGTFSETFLKTSTREDVVINERKGCHLEKLLQYDQSVHIFDRRNHMCEIIDHPSSRTFVAFRDNVICGYGILTKCFLSYKIAPLFADNPDVARALYRRMGQEAPPDSPISMAVSTQNAAAMAIINENPFNVLNKLYKLINERSARDIDINYNKVFCLTGLNLSIC